jgi:hypothetical protein
MTKDLLHELFEYKDSNLVWKVSKARRIKVGDVAGSVNSNGYMQVQINKKMFKVHRLVWIMHNGDIDDELQVDHINRDRLDNCIDNLRLVTPQENSFNSKSRGYSWVEAKKKYVAYITFSGTRKTIGAFDNAEEARKAYLNAKEKYHRIELH